MSPVGARLIHSARSTTGYTAFAVAVAAYGQLLRGDTNLARFSFAAARALAQRGAGGNYLRREFLELTQLAQRQRYASTDGRR